MTDIAVHVENIGKRYRIGKTQKRATTLRQAIRNGISSPFDYLSTTLRAPSDEEILWAVRHVTFEVKQGEVIGIIGRNGAGKSTLLKILSRITEPTEGTARMHGRVGSLLEVGTGFHPELTGRENIYMNGAILGMSRSEIERKFDEIVDFSGVEKFIDTPVKRYSSGMHVRLAFAVAAHLDPEILVIDEVLAVGDAEFQSKCLGKMGDVATEGRTVLFVSHNMAAISQLTSRSIWIQNGVLHEEGATDDIVSAYLQNDTSLTGECLWENGIANQNINEFALMSVRIRDAADRVTGVVESTKSFKIEFEYQIRQELPHCRVGAQIITPLGIVVFTSYDSDNREYVGRRASGSYVSSCEIPGYLLSPGHYHLSINIGIKNVKKLCSLESVLSFKVENTRFGGLSETRPGVIWPQLNWQVNRVGVVSETI